MANKVAIIDKINTYVEKNNSRHSNWYVGIATNPEERLFSDHNVDKTYGKWIYILADSEQIARDAEADLLNKYGYSGGPGGGDHPKYVYSYLKNSNTRE